MRTLALVGLGLLVVACGSVSFPDPEEPAFIAPLQTAIASETPPTPTATVTPSATATPTETPVPVFEYTGVIMGGDFDARVPERNRFGVRSDVFLIYTFKHWPTFPDRNRLTLISLPRDLWIEVPCSPLDPELEGNDRVNAAWAYGQFDCVADMVEANFDLTVNAPMAFTDFDGFQWMVARLGAVKITPNQTYTDFCGNYHGTAGDSGNFVTWYEGETYNMGPNEALCYTRGRRGHPTGDLDRNRRGLEMAQALGEQYAAYLFDTWDPANVASEIFAFMIDGQRYIDLDVDLIDAVKFAPLVGDVATAPRRVVRFSLEETEFYTTPIYGASVLRPTVDVGMWVDCMIERELFLEVDGELSMCTVATRISNAGEEEG